MPERGKGGGLRVPRARIKRNQREGWCASQKKTPASELLYRLRDESEGEETFVARGPSSLEKQVVVEPETREANLSQAREADEEAVAEASRDAKSAPKEALASVLHYETFLKYQDELSQLEGKVKKLAEKRDMYKLLSEQREREAKSLRAELETAQKEHADLVEHVKIFEVRYDELDMVTNGQNLQVQQKIDRIDQLRDEMDVIKVEAEEWKGKMDRLASEKESARAQLTSAESQLRAMREKAEAKS
ncbi:uncharacterized protein [Nicotiana tomentosiformis]|uniref:uncharacterized protein n=1 Tax=Nicotiana tomentosiformis TaxID=4098 RepID=UPI00388CA8C3